MQAATAPSSDDAHYLALKAQDARFDGRFFTGVTTTGIYCRPVCRVRTPKRENCQFFTLAAQAEAAGFRPCLRCRPELAPAASGQPWSIQDASGILAGQAASLLDTADQWSESLVSLAQVAARLGVSERHMRRIFETHWGVSPLQYLQTRRLLTAKQLLTDTQLPIARIALLSGYASVRRFNTVFAERYRLQPRALRKAGQDGAHPAQASIAVRAAYRPPYDHTALLQFFGNRTLDGVEVVDLAHGTLARTLSVEAEGRTLHGWIQVQFVPERCTVEMQVSESLVDALPAVLARLRALLDLDADPEAINAALGDSFPDMEGLRVPGTVDGFELGVRAILGQQITVQAARTLGTRLVQRLGTTITTPVAGLSHVFPSAQILAATPGEVLGELGITRQRQKAIAALADAVAQGSLRLSPGADLPSTLAALQALPGLGPWTANYIAMRALRWPDAFVAGDVALHKALGVQDNQHPAKAAKAAEAASQAWKPWRSYAVIRAWASLAAPGDPPVDHKSLSNS
jgi:AraC family transcriptional regulator of adaptative response / DNA-3-methyladenine glycosylase II